MTLRIVRFLLIFFTLLQLSPSLQAETLDDLRRRADAADAKALYDLALLYETGYADIPCDTVMAISLLRKSADADYPPALNYLGFCHYNGVGVPRDADKALELIQRAAMLGDAKGCNNLGWLLIEGEGIVNDYEKAAYWLRKASDAGLPAAQSQLADLYRKGLGVEQDKEAAESLYLDAVAGGLADAERKLLAMKYPDYLLLSADEALAEGCRMYGAKAFVVATTLFEMAAEKGDRSAKLFLAECYARGCGVNYSFEKGLALYYEAAKEGDASAQFVVAETLEIFPDAIPEDSQGAQYWRQQAALQGIFSAADAARRMEKMMTDR